LKVYTDISSVKIKKPVVTIGVFDGVHYGHAYIIQKLNEKAIATGGESTVITLWPHPRVVLEKSDSSMRFITTIEEKKELLAARGLQNLILIPFTKDFSRMTSKQFVREYLANKIHASYLVMGHNHRFGNDREGDLSKIRAHTQPFGIKVDQLQPVYQEERAVSSSLIRELITSGKIEEANKCLGYTFFIRGTVVHGSKLGRKLGFATANLGNFEPYKILPATGVYAVKVKLGNKYYGAMLNIGYRPTIEERTGNPVIEAHLFNFNDNIYDQQIEISFIGWIREERKFQSLEELTKALHEDKTKALLILEKNEHYPL